MTTTHHGPRPGEGRPAAVDPTAETVVPASGCGEGEAIESTQSEPAEFRRATRPNQGAWIGGVASGVAANLGWPVMLVRVGFIALSTLQFLGVFLYGLLWVLMPSAASVAKEQAPGLESAARTGKRPARRRMSGSDVGMVTALALCGLGAAWLVQVLGLGVSGQFFWPLAFAAAGLALIWRQADPTAEVPAGTSRWLAPLIARGGWLALARMVLGAGLVGTAFTIVVASQIGVALLPTVALLTVLVLAGLGLIAAPFIYQFRRTMAAEREAKILADARADMAAHLHDSVLQTLALIQRQAEDPAQVATLARRQERELRTWLYGQQDEPTQLKAALSHAAQEVDAERGVPVELVCVGDAEMTSGLQALVSAAREAIMNAAKHSGAAKIDVFAEVEDGQVEVFVRDRGVGFDQSTIAEDRHGVTSSIIARMERHGGTATIRSAPGEGTDIKLTMPVGSEEA